MVKAFRACSGLQSRRMSDHDRDVLDFSRTAKPSRRIAPTTTPSRHWTKSIIPPDDEPGTDRAVARRGAAAAGRTAQTMAARDPSLARAGVRAPAHLRQPRRRSRRSARRPRSRHRLRALPDRADHLPAEDHGVCRKQGSPGRGHGRLAARPARATAQPAARHPGAARRPAARHADADRGRQSSPQSAVQQSAVGSRQSAVGSNLPRTPRTATITVRRLRRSLPRIRRGNSREVAAIRRRCLPARRDVLDVGCGRGEFLALLEASGISARGVDTNREMVAAARERGLDVVESDALAYLESLRRWVAGGTHGLAGGGASGAALPRQAAGHRLPEASSRRAARHRDDQPGVLARVFQQLHPRFHARPAAPSRNASVSAAGQRLRARDAPGTASRCPST